jgi:hypothetical protein
MKSENLILEKLQQHLDLIITEKVKEIDKSKFDKLIKEIEKLNSDNENVKRAIAMLKRERDLGECVLRDYLLVAAKDDKLCETIDILVSSESNKDGE